MGAHLLGSEGKTASAKVLPEEVNGGELPNAVGEEAPSIAERTSLRSKRFEEQIEKEIR